MSASHEAGFAIHEGVLPAPEVDALRRAVDEQAGARSRAGARHLLRGAAVAAVAADPRLTRIASAWLDAPAIPFRATLFDKRAGANWLVAWHQDTALPISGFVGSQGWGPWSRKDGIDYAHAPAHALRAIVALRLHLDDSVHDNGPLRVLPGTHDLGVLSDAEMREQALCRAAHVCLMPAGGVLAMRPLLVHASSKCTSARPRRVLHIEYAARLEIAAGIQLRVA